MTSNAVLGDDDEDLIRSSLAIYPTPPLIGACLSVCENLQPGLLICLFMLRNVGIDIKIKTNSIFSEADIDDEDLTSSLSIYPTPP